MRILHLVNHCRMGHGNAHLAVDLACIQAQKGETVLYASEGGELEATLRECGVEHVPLAQRSRNPARLLASLLSLRQIVAGRGIDIVHAHMMSGAVLGYLATRLGPARLVTTVHNSFDSHSRIMRLGDRVVAVSEAERSALQEAGFSPGRLVTIVNATLGGARLRMFATQGALSRPVPVIATVCGLHRRKGVGTVIEAFALVAPAHPCELHIVGDGPDRAALEAQAAATGLSKRIVFHGSLDDPGHVLRGAAIFVLASQAEPMGLVNIEARRAGCAVVASEVGGIPEALDGGEAGILVPPADARAFAGAIARLLAEPAFLERMRRRAGEGLERFTVDRLYSDHARLYAALSRKPRPAADLAGPQAHP